MAAKRSIAVALANNVEYIHCVLSAAVDRLEGTALRALVG